MTLNKYQIIPMIIAGAITGTATDALAFGFASASSMKVTITNVSLDRVDGGQAILLDADHEVTFDNDHANTLVPAPIDEFNVPVARYNAINICHSFEVKVTLDGSDYRGPVREDDWLHTELGGSGFDFAADPIRLWTNGEGLEVVPAEPAGGAVEVTVSSQADDSTDTVGCVKTTLDPVVCVDDREAEESICEETDKLVASPEIFLLMNLSYIVPINTGPKDPDPPHDSPPATLEPIHLEPIVTIGQPGAALVVTNNEKYYDVSETPEITMLSLIFDGEGEIMNLESRVSGGSHGYCGGHPYVSYGNGVFRKALDFDLNTGVFQWITRPDQAVDGTDLAGGSVTTNLLLPAGDLATISCVDPDTMTPARLGLPVMPSPSFVPPLDDQDAVEPEVPNEWVVFRIVDPGNIFGTCENASSAGYIADGICQADSPRDGGPVVQ